MAYPKTDSIASRVALVPCMVCGGTPTAYVRLYGEHGIPDTPSPRYVDGPFCHDCGIATYRKATGWLLSSGWRSVTALVTTPVQALINTGARLQIGRLRPAEPDAATPLPVGRPLLGRLAAYRALIPLAVLLALAGGVVYGIRAIGNNAPRDIAVGQCVQIDGVQSSQLGKYQFTVGQAKVVSCGDQHNGKIVKQVTGEAQCPAADGVIFVTSGDATLEYCIAAA